MAHQLLQCYLIACVDGIRGSKHEGEGEKELEWLTCFEYVKWIVGLCYVLFSECLKESASCWIRSILVQFLLSILSLPHFENASPKTITTSIIKRIEMGWGGILVQITNRRAGRLPLGSTTHYSPVGFSQKRGS